MDVAPSVASHLVARTSHLVEGFAAPSLAGMGFDRAAPLAGMLVSFEAAAEPLEWPEVVEPFAQAEVVEVSKPAAALDPPGALAAAALELAAALEPAGELAAPALESVAALELSVVLDSAAALESAAALAAVALDPEEALEVAVVLQAVGTLALEVACLLQAAPKLGIVA